MDRDKQIIRASVLSIIGNVALAATKGVTGVLTGSIAISLDAINSLTDALSSVIAIIGTRIAGMNPNRDHPFGYGRSEYLASVSIGALILSAGLSSFVESVRSIIHPKTPEYTIVTLSIVAGAALVKFILGFFLLKEGKRLNSGSLKGSGTDSYMDGWVSVSTLVAGILFLTFGWQIESWLAAGIAILISKSGIMMLLETRSKLLGERADPEVISRVEREVRSVDGVKFASGLALLDFGPDYLAGTIHVTVDSEMTIAEFDAVARSIQKRVHNECGVNLAGVTPYPDTSHDEEASRIRAAIGSIVWRHKHVVEMRGLYVDPATSTVRFDAVAEFGTHDLDQLRSQIISACQNAYPEWSFEIRVTPDAAD